MAEPDSRHVTRILRALELLADRPRTPAELAIALDVHPRTARRLLDRLVMEEYAAVSAAESGRRRYTGTLKMLALAPSVVERTDLGQVAPPYVVRLRNEIGEAAHLSVPCRYAVMHLVYEAGPSVVTVKARLGQLFFYHSTAFGKVLLAHLPTRCGEVLERSLEPCTARTLTDPADLLLELAEVRERGFAVDDLENDMDLRSVAAPVFDRAGEAVGALGISAPASRLSPDEFDDLGMTALALANSLSRTLGSVPRRSATLAERRSATLAEHLDPEGIPRHVVPGQPTGTRSSRAPAKRWLSNGQPAAFQIGPHR